jgi:hypothetical protein
MKSRGLLFAILLSGVFAVAGLAQRDTPPRSGGAARWEYGILRMDGPTWRERSRIVEQKSEFDFAAALNAPYSNRSDVFETNLLNALGDQGWELVSVPRGGSYVFKRPR